MRALWCAFVLVVAACGDDEGLVSRGASGEGSAGATADPPVVWSTAAVPAPAMVTACQGLYAAFDAWWTACGQPALATVTREALTERCAATTTLPGLTVTLEAFDGCAQAIAASACTQLPDECVASRYRWPWSRTSPRDTGPLLREGIAYRPDAFDYMELFPPTTGSLEPGQPCDEDRQCATGTCRTGDGSDYTAPSGPSDCGVCVSERRTGEACGGSAVCTIGSSCVDGRCQEDGAPPGAGCFSVKGDSGCQKSTYCDAGYGAGTCVRRPGLGEACGSLAQDRCLDELVCHDGRCATTHPAADGEACDEVTRCPDGSTCDQAVCRKLRVDVPAGGACRFDLCQPPLTCADDVCVPPQAPGATCQLSCGSGLYCLGGTCGPLFGPGDPCQNSTILCGAGLFCDPGPPGSGESFCHPLPTLGSFCDVDHPCPMSLQCTDGACRPIDACSRRR